MRSSLQGIANRARESKKYRFRNLYTMLDRLFLEDCRKHMNRRAAPGVDRITVREYEKHFRENVEDLVERLKRKRYRAKPVKRAYIPKDGVKLRPLGLPAVEDKLLQVAVSRILNAIFEQDFLPCSYGYRPKRGPLDAGRALHDTLQFGPFGYVVEADIRGFFDAIDHEWMVRMLEQRVDDGAFVRLIRKWLKAGVLETDGRVLHPDTGTPQGGIVSPVLSNIYLHYVLDLWFERVFKRDCVGAAVLCRYADDFVCAFQHHEDAERFYAELPLRLAKFGLQTAPDKTRIIRFSRFQHEKNGSFEFLGFEFRWEYSRKGNPVINRRTARNRFRRRLRDLKEWCRENRSLRLKSLVPAFNDKLRGHYNYYGVIGNSKSLSEFYHQARRLFFKWLNRRCQKYSFNWVEFDRLMKKFGLLSPRITAKREVQLKFVFF